MTNYRFFPSTSGPSSPNAYSGKFQAGIAFKLKQLLWLDGYYWWVPPGGDTAAQEFVCWCITANPSGGLPVAQVISSTDVMSGTLTAGQWNLVTLSTPIPMASGTDFVGATGWTAVHGFPVTNNQFGSGDPYASGITEGPMFAFSAGTASAPCPFNYNNGLFDTSSTNSSTASPSVNMPFKSSNDANFWLDLSFTDTKPTNFRGPYTLWPNNVIGNQATTQDLDENYDVVTQENWTTDQLLYGVSYYSPPGATTLADKVSIWKISGQTLVQSITSPTWSGAAGSGWITATFPAGTILPAGDYKIGVYRGGTVSGGSSGWSAKDANTDPWITGDFANGISVGTTFAPNATAAAVATDASNSSITNPWQSTYALGPPDAYPNLYAPVGPSTNETQNYWVQAITYDLDESSSTFSATATLSASAAKADSGTFAARAVFAAAGTRVKNGSATFSATAVFAATGSASGIKSRSAAFAATSALLASAKDTHLSSGTFSTGTRLITQLSSSVIGLTPSPFGFIPGAAGVDITANQQTAFPSAATGVSIPNHFSRAMLLVCNNSGAPVAITPQLSRRVQSQLPVISPYSIPSGKCQLFGPFDRHDFGNPLLVNLAASASGVTVAALQSTE